MTVKSSKELATLLKIGKIVAETMETMGAAIRPGMTTAELDAIGARLLEKYKARSAPILFYNFPGATCISINEEVAHGVPGARVIQPGDLVNIDVCAVLDGIIADTGGTYPVAPVSADDQRLCDATRRGLKMGVGAVRDGLKVNAVGRAVETEANKYGYRIIRELSGHGVGRTIHEKPSVPNYFTARAKERMTDGMVFTIEPFFTTGDGKVSTRDGDKWTLRTAPGVRTAQYEHTVVTKGEPVLVTKL
jgi:methionyl aminopeptidase